MKKLLVVFSVLGLSVLSASVLETNDVKMNTLLGLGGNPAVIAVNKKVNFEAGTVAINLNKQNAKIMNGALKSPIGIKNGRNENDMNFADASRFFWFAGNIGDNWFGLRHTNISNVYPFFTSTIQLPTALQSSLDPNYASKVTIFRKDTVETFSFLWAKELAQGYSVGAELASNTYTFNDNRAYNTAAENINSVFLGGSPFVDSKAFSVSKPYYSLTLGLVKDLDAASKISFAHKMTQDRGVYYNDGLGITSNVYNEKMPNETAVSYIYKINEGWEVAGTYKTIWGVSYQKNILGSNQDYSEAITKHPYNVLGFATDYSLNDKWSFQGWGSYIRNYKQIETSNTSVKPKAVDEMDRGYKVTQVGGNVQYHLNAIKGGTILLGSYVSKIQSEDSSVGYLFDITNTTLSYSQNF